MKKNMHIEKIVRNIFIVLTFISLGITLLNFTYLIYQNMDTYKLNNFLVSRVNTWFLWVDNILLYLVAVIYIILAIKSKKEVVLKVSFSIISILTTMTVLTFVINFIAEVFGMF